MKIKLILAAFGALLTGAAIAGATPAHADGPCLFQGDWNCHGTPQWNGQLQNTWDVPPYTWPKSQLQCDPDTQSCYPAVRP